MQFNCICRKVYYLLTLLANDSDSMLLLPRHSTHAVISIKIVSYMPITPFDQICLLYYYNALGHVYKEAYIGL